MGSHKFCAPLAEGDVYVWLYSLNWASLPGPYFPRWAPLPLGKLRPTMGEGLA